jgi:hypothetical protein
MKTRFLIGCAIGIVVALFMSAISYGIVALFSFVVAPPTIGMTLVFAIGLGLFGGMINSIGKEESPNAD